MMEPSFRTAIVAPMPRGADPVAPMTVTSATASPRSLHAITASSALASAVSRPSPIATTDASCIISPMNSPPSDPGKIQRMRIYAYTKFGNTPCQGSRTHANNPVIGGLFNGSHRLPGDAPSG